MSNSPEPTRQVLNNSAFLDIRRRVDFHAQLLRRVRDNVPAAMAIHCRYCVAREDGGLVIYVDSQAFASQMRFLLPGLQAKLNNAGDVFFIKQITLRNLALTAPSVVTKLMPPMKVPPPEAIEMVKASSQSTSDDELSKALARLGDAMERYAKKTP